MPPEPPLYGDGSPTNPFTFTPPPPAPWWRKRTPRPSFARGGHLPGYAPHRIVLRFQFAMNTVALAFLVSAAGMTLASVLEGAGERVALLGSGAALVAGLAAGVMAAVLVRTPHDPTTCPPCRLAPPPLRDRTLAWAHWLSQRRWTIPVVGVAGVAAITAATATAPQTGWVSLAAAATAGWFAWETRMALRHAQHADRCEQCR